MTAEPEDPISLVLAGTRSAFVAQGDCRKRLKALPDDSVDAVVTDPPAGIEFMGKKWDSFRDVEANPSGKQTATWDESGGANGSRPFARSATPRYRGKTNESLLPFQDFITEVFTDVYRVLKPGGHAVVWALPRTSHHTAMGLERAGFDIRDVVHHLFGTGFPKSLDVSKALSKVGADSEVAANWTGWGTALKPAAENWILVRKPLEGTVARNVQKHSTGALNIDECRVQTVPRTEHVVPGAAGRWPANSVLSHSDGCMKTGTKKVTTGIAYEPDGKQMSRSVYGATNTLGHRVTEGDSTGKEEVEAWDCVPECAVRMLDEQSVSGDTSRFFYTAKAPSAEKAAVLQCACTSKVKVKDIPVVSMKEAKAQVGQVCEVCGEKKHIHAHPTVKSVSLMEWLVKLITPSGGVVLDPFTGSGSTGVAARKLGFRFIGMEQDKLYCALARHRVKNAAPKDET
jgi:site-specific DNA-methyltransferase (adenine-specific)